MTLPFSPPTRAWFQGAFAQPTPVQAQGWPRIVGGENALLLAPTGSGKTLAAFLAGIDGLLALPHDAERGVRVLYISPLKALVYDVERNLRAPLAGIAAAAVRHGAEIRVPRIGIRTGDTPSRDRRAMLKAPPEILVTTPESLYLLLTSQARETLRTVTTVIVDEVHAVAGTKRGAHLALSLERLEELGDGFQRVGLSATVRPVETIAGYLCGRRPCAIIDTSQPPDLDLKVVVPLDDMERPPSVTPLEGGGALANYGADGMGGAAFQQPARAGIWPSLHPVLLQAIRDHRSTILFVNSRGLCERLARRLNELAEEDLVRAHHGSVSHAARKEIEEALKAGTLKGIVATSSLELGIDMGAVDLVLQVASPGSTAAGLQRVGRAGHGVGQTSIGRIFPKFRGDLLECAVVARRMVDGAIETLHVPRNPIDVLAQQIVAMVSMRDWTVNELEAVIKRAAPYLELSRDVLVATLDMLAGRYPSTDFAGLRARLDWDRQTDQLTARGGSKMIALVNGGTIPDRGLYAVYVAPDGPRIGELDEEMVHETRPGETIVLGASTWRVQEIGRDRVLVVPAPGELGKLPFWHGDGPGRPIELGRALGAFLRELRPRLGSTDDAEAWVRAQTPVDERAARNLVAYARDQVEATGALPTDRSITIERFRDELGDWRVCILTPFGDRVHAPWAVALQARMERQSGFEVQCLHTDDGIVLRLADPSDEGEAPPDIDVLLPEPEELHELLLQALIHAPLFASIFRENAARALILTRKRPQERMPLWAQRIRGANLLAVAQQYPDFPVILETYRTCLQDIFDLPALEQVLSDIRSRAIVVDAVETPTASPFARSLVLRLVGTAMYDYDVRLAERRAQALSLDRNLLRELLGAEELRELLDADVIEQLGRELQRQDPDRQARDEAGVQDLLRLLGELSEPELAERCQEDPLPLLTELLARRAAFPVQLAGRPVWIAAEDVALYRDGLGVPQPAGVPAAFLERRDQPLLQLIRRFAKASTPFTAAHLAARWGLLPAQLEPALQVLEADGALLLGEFLPGGREREWCDPAVMQRIRKRTLAKLRGEVAPVEAEVYARFCLGWHHVGEQRRGPRALEEALDQLEGVPLPFTELEARILPARVSGFQPRQLDELGALGQVAWVGRGSLGPSDGLVTVCRRDRVDLLPPSGLEPPDSPLHGAIGEQLRTRGASFLAELQVACGVPIADLQEALWDLVWAGLVTNDTFAPLRTLGRGKPRSTGRSGLRRRASFPLGGRWSLVAGLALPSTDTDKAHAWAVALLERHGVVSKEAVRAEGLPGGFSAVYPVFKAMEEQGTVRRGWFVDGLGGMQFALPGAVDRLRAARTPPELPEARVLAATDPANPYGSLLPWPSREDAAAQPRRTRGASVILVDGALVLFVERGAKSLLTFPAADDERLLVPALQAAGLLARTARGRRIRVERVDGELAGRCGLKEPMLRAGFTEDYRGLVWEA